MIDTTNFWDDGYYLPVDVMGGKEVDAHRHELETLLERWENDPSLMRPMVDYRRANFHVVSKWGAAIAQNRTILDCVEQIIGAGYPVLDDRDRHQGTKDR